MKWLSKIVIVFLFCQVLTAQEFITERNYDNKVGSGIVVVEVWAEFNKANEVSWIGNLKNCKVYRIDIQEASSLKIKTVPTVIVYSSGEEYSRFKAKKDVQEVVDKIILSKFE